MLGWLKCNNLFAPINWKVPHWPNPAKKLEKQTDIPEWMNNPNAEFKDIRYNGDLRGKY